MPTINVVHIVFELWCAFYSAVCAVVALAKDDEVSERGKRLFLILSVNCFLLINDALAWFFRGNVTTLGFYMVRISNFFTFVSSFTLAATVVLYVMDYADPTVIEHPKFWHRVVLAFTVLAVFLEVVTQFTPLFYYFDEHNYYHRASLYWISTGIPIVIILILFAYLMRHRKAISKMEFALYSGFVVVPIIGMIIQTIFYGISLINILNSLIVTVEFLRFELDKAKAYKQTELAFAQQQMVIAEQNLELEKNRNKIMLSQIKPHFMFNCLSSIAQLCRVNPPKAAEAVDYFSQYLRTNLDSLDINAPVPFSTELSHIRAYIWLEKMRFGSDLEFVEDIGTQSFFLPILSVQPVIENAVKHGLAGLEEGVLTVTLKTEETEQGYIITVSDNGNGFDMSKPMDDSRSHVGMRSVKGRIETMMHGTYDIQSKLGEGTTARIYIPKR